MEIVLQWLDEIDDFLFVGLLKWEALRRKLLEAGLVSSLTVGGCELEGVALECAPLLLAIAGGSVVLWTVAAGKALITREEAVLWGA